MTNSYLLPILSKSRLTYHKKNAKGFTLLEVLVVVLIIGILAATAGVSWLSFVNRQRVSAVQNAALRAIEKAQLEARSRQLSYSVSFKIEDNLPKVEFNGSGVWESLAAGLDIRSGQVLMCTNLSAAKANQVGTQTCSPTDLATARTIQFDYTGTLPTDTTLPITITFADPGTDYSAGIPIVASKRCVNVQTLLGAITTGMGSECP
ncbi:Tfp pilus assembly protein FimT/FimU [[Phormidium] sp. ETS-05]|uniref:pilus assembly FimT family protein n=1 Tax=[Phormidium] sp. ETS-05 TaxID=222819 RepID=UPI0018EF139F|nr:prepilin-type N-terminal cleavage/methylation domain-containing protein [[Phormidium] sp. ETS-05]